MKTPAIILAAILATSSYSIAAMAASNTKVSASRSEVLQYSSDAIITAKVRAALFAEKDLKSLDLRVMTDNGTVQLSGIVISDEQIDQAVDVTLHVKGVKDVINDLSLKASI